METDCIAAGDVAKRWEGILGSTNCFVYLSSGGLTDEGEGWVENNSLLLSLRPSRADHGACEIKQD